MNQAGRLVHSPESALNLIGGNDVSNAERYPMPGSANAPQQSPALPPQELQNQVPYNDYGSRDIGDLLHDLMTTLPHNQVTDAVNDFSSELNKHMYSLMNHRLMPNLYGVLQEIKEKTGLSLRHSLMAQGEDNQPDAQIQRLDTMLVAEGVIDPPPGYNVPRPNSQLENTIENGDYRDKLQTIKQWYHEKLGFVENRSKEFTGLVLNLLQNQSQVRPLLPKETEQLAARIIEKKMRGIQIQLKQQACEEVMSLRSRFLDARRKRRNFTKQASEILNTYFFAHLSNPYPSEETKEDLARQCNITVSQVNNWFGNKRIRYKKNLGKSQEEANLYAAKKAVSAVANGAGRSAPYPVASNRSHGTPTPPMLSPAPSVSSQPDFQAAYGMNFGVYPGYPYPGPGPSGYDPMNFPKSSPDSQ